jgi:iron complex outermembrane receptor protein
MRKKIQTPALGPLIAQEYTANAFDKYVDLDCDQILSATRGGPVSRGKHGWLKACVLLGFSLIILRTCALAQTTPAQQSSSALKKLSIDELMDLEVTSVSKRPEKLSDTASAIQVITQEEIHRSGATSLPEALRLASNLQVAQVDSRQWAISARGFKNTTANKMLVLIDGRTVYTPLYAGVFWDVQDTLLEDVDRIEVISGPGATLWGANAVNGVINVITKNARDTQGLLVESGGGTQLRGFMNLRYGGKYRSNLNYRAYGKFFDRGSTLLSNNRDAANKWHVGQGGFRMDWDQSRASSFTLQGDYYDGRMDQLGTADTTVKGGNLLGRWSHRFSERSNLNLQLYYDRTQRRVPNTFSEDLATYDLDLQHDFAIGDKHRVIWGFGYRQTNDNVQNTPGFAFLPSQITRRSFSGFLQDEISLIKGRLNITLGTKIERNSYTGFEVQPSARVSWKIDRKQIGWGAVSRAIRTPSRIDRELFVPATSPFLLAGGPDFQSEQLLAYELGYRVQFFERASVSAAGFFNDYSNLRSLEQVSPPRPFPLVIGNGLKGKSYGVELSGDYRPTNWLRLRAGYTEMRIKIRPEATSTDRTRGSGESHDPDRQLLLRSSFDLTRHFEVDSTFRFVSGISNQRLPGYADLDLRVAWQPKPSLEFSIVGQNLLHPRHAEFGSPSGRQQIERGVYGRVLWRFLKH